MVKSLTNPPVPEDLIVDLCVNSASSLPPKEQSGGGWMSYMSWYQKPVSQVPFRCFLLQENISPVSVEQMMIVVTCARTSSFSKCRRILGMAMPSFWSRNAAYFGPCRDWDPVLKKTTAWCLNDSMLHKKIAPNSYWNSSYLRASKSSSGKAWVLRRSDQGLLIFMAWPR